MPSKIVHLPFSYPVSGIAARHRIPDTYHFLDEVAVEIPIVSAADAPVAVRLLSHDGKVEHEQRAFNRVPIRPFAGGSATIFGQKTPAIGLAEFEVLADAVRRQDNVFWPDYPLPLERGMYGDPPAMIPRELFQFRRVDHDGHDHARAEAERAARQLVVVDGELHCRDQEVRWRVHTEWYGGGWRIAVTAAASPLTSEVFRGDRYADAVKFAKFLSRLGKQQKRVVGYKSLEQTGEIDWTLPDTEQSIAKGLEDVFDKLGGEYASQIRHLPPAALSLIPELKRLSHPTSVNIGEKLDFMQRLNAALKHRPIEANDLCLSIRAPLLEKLWRYKHIDGLLAPMDPADELALAL